MEVDRGTQRTNKVQNITSISVYNTSKIIYNGESWSKQREGGGFVAVFVFPAVKGRQAGRDYYISMVPLEIIPRIFQFAEEGLPPEIRAQRTLNKARIPEIRDYILDNPDSYVFSSLTVSVDGDLRFRPMSEETPDMGNITIPMSARLLINDGQHRRAAIAEALKKNPALQSEHISVVFFHDQGLRRSQQVFSDLNRYAVRPTRSINILYNSREEASVIANEVSERVAAFRDLTEKEKTALSNRSRALFTLSAICSSTERLLEGLPLELPGKTDLAVAYWSAASLHMAEWKRVKAGTMRASEVRKEYISSLSLTLVALGQAGNALVREHPDRWQEALAALEEIDWRKQNPRWETLVIIGGNVASTRATQQAMAGYLETLLRERAASLG